VLLHKISGFRCGVDEVLASMGCYAVYIVRRLIMFHDSMLVSSSRVLEGLTREDGADMLSRNVGQQLSTYAE
jgi:hypothetical protein